MGIEMVRNHISNSVRICYRSASRHPLLVFMVFVLIWTYIWFPLLFTLLLHASPVIASTFLLLGTLLFYGHANAPAIQKEGTSSHHHDIHNLVFGGMGNNEFDEETYVVHNMNINDGHKFGISIDSRVSRKQEGNSELGSRRPVLVNRGGQFQPFETGNPQLKSRDGSRSDLFDPLHSVLGHIDDDDNKGWDSGSDASLADNIPMLDEHLPLLESGGIINETDYDVDDQYDHEDIVVKDDYDDDDETLIRWTEDNQRNLMNMGTLELERNQRLESLVARQKVIKNMRMLAEKNMANISPDIRFMDAHISTAGNNPFDLPNHSHENIIGSAPSNMQPRRHSLQLPYDPHGGKPDQLGPTFQFNSVALPTNLPLGRRQRSSDVGTAGHSSQYLYSAPVRIGSDTESIILTHASDINEHIIPRRRRLSLDGDTVKLNQAAGFEDKTSNKSSSSSFCDLTDDINDGDDNSEEEEFGSVNSPTTPDLKDEQDMDDSGDSYTDTDSDSENDGDSDSDSDEAGFTERLISWFTE
ncbi:hypothetical protein M8C21_032330, partial [Ambrosia artemisiifolia]